LKTSGGSIQHRNSVFHNRDQAQVNTHKMIDYATPGLIVTPSVAFLQHIVEANAKS
jgi:hypothetical protein